MTESASTAGTSTSFVDTRYRRFMCKCGDWDSPVYALTIAIGVPMLGYAPNGTWKLWVMIWWLVIVSLLYWYVEIYQILDQIRRYGVLQRDESDKQRSSMQSLYWGALVAGLFWGFPYFVYLVTMYNSREPIWIGPAYGVIEWIFIFHTVAMGRFTIVAIYAVISEFQEALAAQRRRETETHA